MATSEPEPDLAQQQRLTTDYGRFLHASTLAGCILAPVLIALPPRKVDLFTFSLSGAFIASANYQVRERTGLGIMGHASKPFISRASIRAQVEDDPSPIATQHRILEEPAGSSIKSESSSILQTKAQDDWKAQRLREEQEKLDQGEGYGSMIADQIWQVWNQGEKNMEEVKEKDEEVVKEREEKG